MRIRIRVVCSGVRAMAASSAEPRVMSAREHALRASELAAAIQPASERFSEEIADPMKHTEAIATGAIKAHNAAIEYTLRMAELHARVADVLLRTEGMGP